MTNVSKLIPYFKLTRAANIFTVVSNIAAAHIIALDGHITLEIIPLLIISALLYHGGMALNDCLDVETDRLENPDRPLPSNEISQTRAWSLVIVFFALAEIIAASMMSTTTLLLTTALVVMIVIYNRFVKSGIPGSMVMGSCRYLNWMLGLSVAPLAFYSWITPIPILLYVTGLTILSKEEHSGANKTALLVCTILVLLALGMIFVGSTNSIPQSWTAYIAILLFAAWLIKPVTTCWKEFKKANIIHLMKTLILGIIPLDAIMVFSQGHYVAGILIALLLPISLKAAKHLYVT